MKKVKGLKGEKVKELKAEAKPKMTAVQKACLEACKRLDANVERAKHICEISTFVRREMCKTCKNDGCKETVPNAKCVLASIMSVIIGILQEEGGDK